MILGSFSFCNPEDELPAIRTEDGVAGVWEISPVSVAEMLDFDREPGLVVWTSTPPTQGAASPMKKPFPQEEIYLVLSDGVGIRIQKSEETTPTGYFLFKDRKEGTWTGIWKEELVRLLLR